MSLKKLLTNYPPTSLPDKQLFLCFFIITIIGFFMIFTASNIIGLHYFNDGYYYVKKHLGFILLGGVSFTIGYKTPHQLWRKYRVWIWLITTILLFITLLPGIGVTVGGSSRWISLLGIRFQPSELMKFSIILLTADYLDKFKDSFNNFKTGLLPLLLMVGLSLALILKQPDLSTTLVICLIFGSMLFVAGLSLKYILLLGGLLFILGSISLIINPYQVIRIKTLFDPWSDPLGKGFHVIQSLIAIGSGGIFGLGLGLSRQKFLYLPQQYTDYIFSIMAEEFGFFMTSFFIIFFLYFITRAFLVGLKSTSLYSKLLAMGITSWISFQSIININVALSLFPSTGVTLPFISFGGTSTVILMGVTGILLNISRYR